MYLKNKEEYFHNYQQLKVLSQEALIKQPITVHLIKSITMTIHGMIQNVTPIID